MYYVRMYGGFMSFDYVILNGRPACGKSEFIDFIKKTDDATREEEYHISNIKEIDDFPWIYEKFIEDDIWESVGSKRLYSKALGDKTYNTTDYGLYDFMMGKLNREIKNNYLCPDFLKNNTLFIEFSRGGNDAYKRSLNFLDQEILKRSVIFHIWVSFEESKRKNIVRSPGIDGEQGILKHKVPKDVIEGYYRDNDWLELADGKDSGQIEVNGISVPFVTMKNEPELPAGEELAVRYKEALDELYMNACTVHPYMRT